MPRPACSALRERSIPKTGEQMTIAWPPASSLARRIRTMHRLWRAAVSDLTLEQVNHHERSGVLPIAFSLLHYVRGEDNVISANVLKGPALWDEGGWAAKIGVTIEQVPRGTAMDEAERIRFGSIDVWREYQSAVFQRTDSALHNLPITWNEELYDGTVPASLEGAFIWYVIEPGGPVDAIECFVYQHGIRHLGEIEHARALVGLGGTS